MVTQFSLWIPEVLAKFCFLHIFKARKNIPVLVWTTHRKPENLEMRRQNVCAVTKVSTVLKYQSIEWYQLLYFQDERYIRQYREETEKMRKEIKESKTR